MANVNPFANAVRIVLRKAGFFVAPLGDRRNSVNFGDKYVVKKLNVWGNVVSGNNNKKIIGRYSITDKETGELKTYVYDVEPHTIGGFYEVICSGYSCQYRPI